MVPSGPAGPPDRVAAPAPPDCHRMAARRDRAAAESRAVHAFRPARAGPAAIARLHARPEREWPEHRLREEFPATETGCHVSIAGNLCSRDRAAEYRL